jgi:LuxR family transcriptional regulator
VKTWQEDQIQALLSADCEQKLFPELVTLAHDLGFDFCAYGLLLPLPVSNPKTMIFSNYPGAWQARYQQKNYLAVDPTVRHGMRSLLPVLWSDDVFASAHDLWEDAQSFGLHVGWAQSNRDMNGAAGMLTLARSGVALSAAELRHKGLRMAWLTQVAHLGMSQCLTARLMPEIEVILSSRETEVLRWTAEGKTSSEVSEILGISERTVNFHINNAVAKLNASNKTAAAIRAALLGMLY